MEVLEKGTNIIKNVVIKWMWLFFLSSKSYYLKYNKVPFPDEGGGGGGAIKILLLVKAFHDDTMRHRSAILVLFIILKDFEIFSGANLKPCMIAYFYIYFKNLWKYCWKISCSNNV